ncbi:hypothetical protein L249_0218 [Ophiocordyceps polyrhachis-furcata BCC 54312]|uniref:MICOS complex subunit MIC60 n=1 Tax=Ophiocordyceps polyrhachis-furcata BCC 54312 TaxID=1330021 RepID=A0A367LD69_9HYPO|nr:hypothetical protein L249_0218 [Ophiocordyceps polyrhachis-furcata BCC 54312]
MSARGSKGPYWAGPDEVLTRSDEGSYLPTLCLATVSSYAHPAYDIETPHSDKPGNNVAILFLAGVKFEQQGQERGAPRHLSLLTYPQSTLHILLTKRINTSLGIFIYLVATTMLHRPSASHKTRYQQTNQPQQSTTNHHPPTTIHQPPSPLASQSLTILSAPPLIDPSLLLIDIVSLSLDRLRSPRVLLPLPLGFRIYPLRRHSPSPGKRITMAARGPAAPRGINNRFAQFKLVLLGARACLLPHFSVFHADADFKGESAVGKVNDENASTVLRFVKVRPDQFDSFRESTIGAAFLTQTISLDENTTVKFEIWDTAGQERYKSLAPMYYRNANCAVVSSLDKAKAWVKELQRQANENIIIALAGNKLDLVNQQPDKRAISTNEAEAYAREAGLLFFETSAKTAENVRELFTAIAKKLPLDQVGPRHARPGQRPGVSLNPENANTNMASLNALHANHLVGLDGFSWADTSFFSLLLGFPYIILKFSSPMFFSQPVPASKCLLCRGKDVRMVSAWIRRQVQSLDKKKANFERVGDHVREFSRWNFVSSPASVEPSLAPTNSPCCDHRFGHTPAWRVMYELNSCNRPFSDKKTPGDASETPVLPSSQTLTSQRCAAPHGLGEAKLGAATKLPPTPPTPQEAAGGRDQPPTTLDDVGESKVLQKNAPPPPTPPPPRKSFARRLRNLVLSLVLLSIAGFGGGVLYSRSNDNFHDFFTEYIPYGEQAVLYLEEMDYKSKFPKGRGRASQVSGEDSKQVKISAQSGASWRVADSGEPSGRHSNASSRAKESAPTTPKVEPAKAEPTVSEPVAKPSKATPRIVDAGGKTVVASKEPEVNEPSKFLALKPIDLMSLPDAKEPIVRDLVRMVNDLILVINADGAHARYGTTMEKAKKDVANVGARLKAMKIAVEEKAAAKVKSSIGDFEKAATDLIQRVEKTMLAQEMEWRREFEQEMKTVRDGYDERVKVLLEQEKKLNETKVENKLLEQALALKRVFTQEVKSQVEQERKGRLAKLADMSSTVSKLEKLMAGWNEVLDSNLKTQQLHVAVEAVRASLEDGQNPRPFIKELVALKEIAADDAVVDAAISSVNPVAYQRGISTSLQLMDRFRRVASEVRKASLLPDDAGVASHASSWALSHLLFKKQGLAEGDDVESILTRAQTHLEEGDLDSAAREMNGLQGWAKTLSKDWLGEVRKVLEVQQALDVIATEARLQSLRAVDIDALLLPIMPMLCRRSLPDDYPDHPSAIIRLLNPETNFTSLPPPSSYTSNLISHSLPSKMATFSRARWRTAAAKDGRRALSTKARTYDEALQKLESLPTNKSATTLFTNNSHEAKALNEDSLKEMRFWLRRSGHDLPDLARMRTVHVAGTKGKGSICAFATAMLLRAGRSVGTYTSPHLTSPRERVAVDGKPLGRQDFADAVFELDERLASVSTERPFFFRFMTLLAWRVFLKFGIRDVVMECGIGGEYDATNVLPGQAVSATVISQLEKDHVAMLGDSISSVAWHKAGIMKEGVRCFARHHPLASPMLRQRAVEKKAAALCEVDDEHLRLWPGVKDGLGAASFQKANQALAALAVREHLGLEAFDDDLLHSLLDLDPNLVAGLSEAHLAGRCQRLDQDGIAWLIDGAHTAESLAAVASWFASSLTSPEEQVVLVFNQQDRDPAPLLAALVSAVAQQTRRSDVFREALFTRNDRLHNVADQSVQKRAATAMGRLAPACRSKIVNNVSEAVSCIQHMPRPVRVLVTGSLHLVGSVLRLLDPDVPL